jgi:cystinosin
MTLALLPALSTAFGWIYTLAWSLSFYPQPLLNLTRRSTAGTTIDFPAINVLGFLAYLVSNSVFYYSKTIRGEYAARNHGLTPTVQFNDVVFAGHAVVLSSLTASMYIRRLWGFDEGGKGVRHRVSKPVLGINVGSFLGVCIVTCIVLARRGDDVKTGWGWIDVVSASSYLSQLYCIGEC